MNNLLMPATFVALAFTTKQAGSSDTKIKGDCQPHAISRAALFIGQVVAFGLFVISSGIIQATNSTVNNYEQILKTLQKFMVILSFAFTI